MISDLQVTPMKVGPSMSKIYDFVFKGKRVARAIEINPNSYSLDLYVPSGTYSINDLELLENPMDKLIAKVLELIGEIEESKSNIEDLIKAFLDALGNAEWNEVTLELPNETIVYQQMLFRPYLRSTIEIIKRGIEDTKRESAYLQALQRIRRYNIIRSNIERHNRTYNIFPDSFASELRAELNTLIMQMSMIGLHRSRSEVAPSSYARSYPTKKGGLLFSNPNREPMPSEIIAARLDHNAVCPKCGAPFYSIIDADPTPTDSEEVGFHCDICKHEWDNDDSAYNLSSVKPIPITGFYLGDLVFKYHEYNPETEEVTISIHNEDHISVPLAIMKTRFMKGKTRSFQLSYNVENGMYEEEGFFIFKPITYIEVFKSAVEKIHNFLGMDVNLSFNDARAFYSLLILIAGNTSAESVPGGIDVVRKVRYMVRPVIGYLINNLKQSLAELDNAESEMAYYKRFKSNNETLIDYVVRFKFCLVNPETRCQDLLPGNYLTKWLPELEDLFTKLLTFTNKMENANDNQNNS